MAERVLRLCQLYPAWLDLCGERAAVLAWRQRCRWRGWELEVHTVDGGERFIPDAYDLVLLGGGDEAAHLRACADLERGNGGAIAAAVADEVVFLCLGGGMQLLGRSFATADGTTRPGLGVLDLETRVGRKRRNGEVVADCEALREIGRDPLLVGFASHPAHTFLGAGARPLARVKRGPGNHESDDGEGIVQGNLFGTHIQGGLLAQNPDFADHLLAIAARRRYGAGIRAFDPENSLDEPFTHEARSYYLSKKP